jgi:hypothetical protein
MLRRPSSTASKSQKISLHSHINDWKKKQSFNYQKKEQ